MANISPEQRKFIEEELQRRRAERMAKEAAPWKDASRGRSVFMAAAWVLGATQAQLGRLFGISKQSVQNRIYRVLDGKPPRNAGTMDTDRLKILWEAYASREAEIAHMDVLAVASLLYKVPLNRGADERQELERRAVAKLLSDDT